MIRTGLLAYELTRRTAPTAMGHRVSIELIGDALLEAQARVERRAGESPHSAAVAQTVRASVAWAWRTILSAAEAQFGEDHRDPRETATGAKYE
jgi:Arc/MetJ family transcription regulator